MNNTNGKNFSCKLHNGITFSCDKMENIESVVIEILFKVGSRHEVKNLGISHCIEHMLFKGTKNRTSKEISEEVENIGGYMNAYTSHETTGYYIKTLKENVYNALDVLYDITHNAIHPENELKTEKTVIINEIIQSLDDPGSSAFMKLQETAFKKHKIGSPIAGTVESVSNISRTDMIDYMNKHYINENAVISVAGNVDQSDVRKFIEKKFDYTKKDSTLYSNLDNTNVDTEKGEGTPTYIGGYAKEEKEIEQVHLCLGFMGYDRVNPQYYIQKAVSIILGNGSSSRLFQEVREKRGLAYSISSFTAPYADCGIFGVYGITQAQHVSHLVDIVLQEIIKLSQEVSNVEIERAKMQMKSSLLMSQESSSKRAGKAASDHAIFGRYVSVDEILEKIESINRESITQYVVQMIRDSSKYPMTTSVVGNKQGLVSEEEVLAKCRTALS